MPCVGVAVVQAVEARFAELCTGTWAEHFAGFVGYGPHLAGLVQRNRPLVALGGLPWCSPVERIEDLSPWGCFQFEGSPFFEDTEADPIFPRQVEGRGLRYGGARTLDIEHYGQGGVGWERYLQALGFRPGPLERLGIAQGSDGAPGFGFDVAQVQGGSPGCRVAGGEDGPRFRFVHISDMLLFERYVPHIRIIDESSVLLHPLPHFQEAGNTFFRD